MESQYLELLAKLLQRKSRPNRTGINTRSLFGYQMRFNLEEGFPLLTTKKMHTKSIIHELLWFLSGSTDVKYLQNKGVRIWDEWATKEQCAKFGREPGDLGPVYGHQWRSFGKKEFRALVVEYPYASKRVHIQDSGFDQITNVIEQIKTNPNSRRLIVSAWNPSEADSVALPPCHTLFQFYVDDGKLSCHMYQRSGDAFLGVPFNIASYALLTHMVAHVCDLGVGDFVHSFGDVHIYENHIPQVLTQLEREPRDFPKLVLSRKVDNIFDFVYEDFSFEGYNPHPAISAEVAV